MACYREYANCSRQIIVQCVFGLNCMKHGWVGNTPGASWVGTASFFSFSKSSVPTQVDEASFLSRGTELVMCGKHDYLTMSQWNWNTDLGFVPSSKSHWGGIWAHSWENYIMLNRHSKMIFEVWLLRKPSWDILIFSHWLFTYIWTEQKSRQRCSSTCSAADRVRAPPVWSLVARAVRATELHMGRFCWKQQQHGGVLTTQPFRWMLAGNSVDSTGSLSEIRRVVIIFPDLSSIFQCKL